MPGNAVRIVVSGMVQGVGFRYYIYRQGIRAFDVGYAVVLGLFLALGMLVLCVGLIRLLGRKAG